LQQLDLEKKLTAYGISSTQIESPNKLQLILELLRLASTARPDAFNGSLPIAQVNHLITNYDAWLYASFPPEILNIIFPEYTRMQDARIKHMLEQKFDPRIKASSWYESMLHLFSGDHLLKILEGHMAAVDCLSKTVLQECKKAAEKFVTSLAHTPNPDWSRRIHLILFNIHFILGDWVQANSMLTKIEDLLNPNDPRTMIVAHNARVIQKTDHDKSELMALNPPPAVKLQNPSDMYQTQGHTQRAKQTVVSHRRPMI
jgi:hypothetical protein